MVVTAFVTATGDTRPQGEEGSTSTQRPDDRDLVVAAVGAAAGRGRVSRTVGYAFVTLVLAGIYVGSVLLLGGALEALTGEGSPVVVAGSTLLAAAAFRPLRAHVQRRVDRSFNRSRDDAQRAVESFGAQLRSQFDPQGVASDVTTVANRLLRPTHIDLWLAPGLPPPESRHLVGD